jgi:hypothetical protein
VSQSFPSPREHSAPNPEVLPPPVAPPLHEERLPVPRPVAFVDAPPEPAMAPTAPDLRDLAELDDDPVPLLGPADGTTAPTALRQRPATAPVAVTIPRAVRIRAGLGLLLFTTLAGAGLAGVLLVLIGLGIRTLGGI